MTNKGLHIDLEVCKLPMHYPVSNSTSIAESRVIEKFKNTFKSLWAAPLNCTGETGKQLVIYLVDVGMYCKVGPVEELPEQYSSAPKVRREFFVRQNPTNSARALDDLSMFILYLGWIKRCWPPREG
jgi:hypothetical protein